MLYNPNNGKIFINMDLIFYEYGKWNWENVKPSQ